VEFESDDLALASVVNGDTYGYMSIPQNFSDNIFDRFLGGELDGAQMNETIFGSQIHFGLDMSSNVI